MKNAAVVLTPMRLGITATFLSLICSNGQAQPTRAEVFALGGGGRLNGEEGSLGTGWSASAAVTVPFSSRWALDMDATHMDAERHVGPLTLTGRHTHLSPAIQYRGGSARTYGFVAFGGGLSVVCDGGNFPGAHRCDTETGFHAALRGGFVHAFARRWLIRGEVFAFFPHVAPDVGVRVGFGYRF